MLAFISNCFSSICLRLYVQENRFFLKIEKTKNTEIKEKKKDKKKKKKGGGGGGTNKQKQHTLGAYSYSAIKYWKTCDFLVTNWDFLLA